MNTSHVRNLAATLSLLSMFVLATGCSSRDVDVTGEATAAQGASVKGAITLQFFEVEDGKAGDSIKDVKIDKLGSFTQTVSISGDTMRVIAINDVDGDGKCTTGEAWAQVDATIKDDDTVDPLKLELSNAACP